MRPLIASRIVCCSFIHAQTFDETIGENLSYSLKLSKAPRGLSHSRDHRSCLVGLQRPIKNFVVFPKELRPDSLNARN